MDLDSLLKSIREENKGGAIVPAKFFGEDRYEKYATEMAKDGTLDGDKLTREERIEGVRAYRRGKIDFETFVNKVLKTRDEIKKQGQEQDTSDSSSSSLPESKGSAMVKRDSVNIDMFKPTEKTQKNFDDIQRGIDSILESLREENSLAKDKSDADRLKEEERKRKAQETKLEKPFEKLGGVVGAVLKPVKSLWEKIWNFIWNVFLGRTVVKLFEWFGKEENKKSLEAIGVFLKNTWPAILAAFLVFGTGLGGFIKGIVGLTTKFIPKIVKMVAKLAKSAVKFAISNPLAALAIAGGVATVAGLAQQATSKSNDEERAKEGKTQLDDTQEFGGISGDPMGGLFSGGGGVPGTGDKDTVPAMLTPGEFVMSKGAVQKYGMDTLESMNAMGGGTNLPERMDGITYAAGGGMIGGGMADGGMAGGGDEEKKEKMPPGHDSLMKQRDDEEEPNFNSDTAESRLSDLMKTTDPKKISDYDSKHGEGAYQAELKQKLERIYNDDSTFGVPPGVEMIGGGGGTNALTEQAKVRTIRQMIFDPTGIKAERKHFNDPQSYLTDEEYENRGNFRDRSRNIKTTGPLLGRLVMGMGDGSWGLPPGVPGLGGGGGGTNALTNQAKVRTFGGILGDLFSVFKKKEIDPQTILGDVESRAKNIATSMGGTVVDSNSHEENMKRVMSLPPEMREAVLADMKRTESNQINIKNTPIASSQTKLKTPPPPQRSRPSVTSIPSMGSNNSSGGGELEPSGIDNSKPSHTVPRGRDKAKTLGVLI